MVKGIFGFANVKMTLARSDEKNFFFSGAGSLSTISSVEFSNSYRYPSGSFDSAPSGTVVGEKSSSVVSSSSAIDVA